MFPHEHNEIPFIPDGTVNVCPEDLIVRGQPNSVQPLSSRMEKENLFDFSLVFESEIESCASNKTHQGLLLEDHHLDDTHEAHPAIPLRMPTFNTPRLRPSKPQFRTADRSLIPQSNTRLSHVGNHCDMVATAQSVSGRFNKPRQIKSKLDQSVNTLSSIEEYSETRQIRTEFHCSNVSTKDRANTHIGNTYNHHHYYYHNTVNNYNTSIRHDSIPLTFVTAPSIASPRSDQYETAPPTWAQTFATIPEIETTDGSPFSPEQYKKTKIHIPGCPKQTLAHAAWSNIQRLLENQRLRCHKSTWQQRYPSSKRIGIISKLLLSLRKPGDHSVIYFFMNLAAAIVLEGLAYAYSDNLMTYELETWRSLEQRPPSPDMYKYGLVSRKYCGTSIRCVLERLEQNPWFRIVEAFRCNYWCGTSLVSDLDPRHKMHPRLSVVEIDMDPLYNAFLDVMETIDS